MINPWPPAAPSVTSASGWRRRTWERGDDAVGRAMLRSRRAKSPPARHWLAYLDGEAGAYLSSWEGIERAFSRLKGYRKLSAIRTRRLPKVWLHVAVSLLSMASAVLANSARSQTSV